ncbi:MAG: DNA photolyase family protein [Rhizobacter sp.]|nr:DNA photolyase family protein [Rhizobacter sp.]
MEKPLASALVWFRRDLRASDNAALYHALKSARQVWCVFVFDREILDSLPRADRRVEFILASLVDLNQQLAELGAGHGQDGVALLVRYAHASREIGQLAAALGVQAVFANHDDDPAALRRDAEVRTTLDRAGIAFHTSKDHVIFERSELLTGGGKPYAVFTPFKRAWLKKVDHFYLQGYAVARHAGSLAPLPPPFAAPLPTLAEIGFTPTDLPALNLPAGSSGGSQMLADFLQRIDAYGAQRDYPSLRGPSHLSVHLRFGTVSIRELARQASQRAGNAAQPSGAAVWLSELIWRDFYHQILHHHPQVVTSCFKPEFDAIQWVQGAEADRLFSAWCEGRTGYPLVDAAMAQLNQTGYMHNRLRMLAASFLVKDLGLDWRRGEAYFARQLLDFDLAANNGGWQWAAATGCDAQPWFRIFNPVRQSERFDPDGTFIRRFLPQLARLPNAAIHAPWQARSADLDQAGVRLGMDYPLPLVQHEQARLQTLARYKQRRPGT